MYSFIALKSVELLCYADFLNSVIQQILWHRINLDVSFLHLFALVKEDFLLLLLQILDLISSSSTIIEVNMWNPVVASYVIGVSPTANWHFVGNLERQNC